MRFISLTLKDISQILRDKRSVLLMLLMPVVFTGFMGFALGRSSTASNQNLALGWTNLDGNSPRAATAPLPGSFERAAAGPRWMAVRQKNRSSKESWPLPWNSRPVSANRPWGGDKVQLTLLADDTSSAGQTVHQIVQTVLMRSLSTVEIARLAEQQTENSNPPASQAAQQNALLQTLAQADQAWQKQG